MEAARLHSLRAEDGRELDTSRWEHLMDLTLADIGDRYTGTDDLVDVARHGHFTCGRPWEGLTVE